MRLFMAADARISLVCGSFDVAPAGRKSNRLPGTVMIDASIETLPMTTSIRPGASGASHRDSEGLLRSPSSRSTQPPASATR